MTAQRALALLTGLLVAGWIATSVAYHTSTGVRLADEDRGQLGSVSVFFRRQFDTVLFRINDEFAFEVDQLRGASIVFYEPAPVVLRGLCGAHRAKGHRQISATYRNGDWYYSAGPRGEFWESDALNVTTKEILHVAGPRAGPQALYPETRSIAAYRRNDLTFADEHRLGLDTLLNEYSPLSTVNDSCRDFNVSFLAAFALLAMAWLVTFVGAARSGVSKES